jgi:hypothetical protein
MLIFWLTVFSIIRLYVLSVGSPEVISVKRKLLSVMKDGTHSWESRKFPVHTPCTNCKGPPVLKVCVTSDAAYHYKSVPVCSCDSGWKIAGEVRKPTGVTLFMLDIVWDVWYAHCFVGEAYSIFRPGKEHVLLRESWLYGRFIEIGV